MYVCICTLVPQKEHPISQPNASSGGVSPGFVPSPIPQGSAGPGLALASSRDRPAPAAHARPRSLGLGPSGIHRRRDLQQSAADKRANVPRSVVRSIPSGPARSARGAASSRQARPGSGTALHEGDATSWLARRTRDRPGGAPQRKAHRSFISWRSRSLSLPHNCEYTPTWPITGRHPIGRAAANVCRMPSG